MRLEQFLLLYLCVTSGRGGLAEPQGGAVGLAADMLLKSLAPLLFLLVNVDKQV